MTWSPFERVGAFPDAARRADEPLVSQAPALPAFVAEYQRRVDRALDAIVPPETEPPAEVHRSMRYTVLAPSKRIRAAVALLSAEMCGREERALEVACATELVHAASLILDDLPAMDNAPLRRGRPANHLVFGEATAILASFGLLALAFERIARAYEPPLAARLASLYAETIGTRGLVGGQADDLVADRAAIDFERLERIHRLKTGVLFGAAATAGALAAGAGGREVAALAAYAKNLGLAFQIVDDLLDVEGDPARTGKATRQDLKKTTFVSFSGTAGARQLARELCQTAAEALAPFGPLADRLRELAAFVAGRSA
jgi:geranylgeranyl pyrophosphate synthase